MRAFLIINALKMKLPLLSTNITLCLAEASSWTCNVPGHYFFDLSQKWKEDRNSQFD